MNPNDLPLKEKLAALIEAGRACHPNMAHSRGSWGGGDSGCAMTFAMKGAGLELTNNWPEDLAAHLGADSAEVYRLAKRVMRANDCTALSLPEIVQAVRDETLPDAPPKPSGLMYFVDECASLNFMQISPPAIHGGGIVYTYFGNADIAWDLAITKPKAKAEKIAVPAKKVRTSAKNGATWPVAKGCYA